MFFKNVLNEKLIKRSWIFWFCEIFVILFWIVVNCFDFKVILYNNIVIIIIYLIGKIFWKKFLIIVLEVIFIGNLKNGIVINNVIIRVVIVV